MRRATAILLLPLAALAACATGGGQGIPTTLRSGYESQGTANRAHALRVRLLESGNGLMLDLNRPAHTAVFEIIPGQGVAMVYPRLGQREFALAGNTYLSRNISRHHFWGYDHTRPSPYGFASSMGGPRHLLVIASDRPLLTGRFRRSTGMLRRVMGTTSYTSLNSTRVVDDLLATVIPPQPDASWDADVVTVWPNDGGPALPAGDLHRIRCRNGAMYWVPLELAGAACRNPERVVPPLRGDSVPTQPVDSGTVQKPGGRRPQPDSAATGDPRVRVTDADGSYRKGLPADPHARELRLAELRRSLEDRQARFRGTDGGQWRRPGDQASSSFRPTDHAVSMPRPASNGEVYGGGNNTGAAAERASQPATGAAGEPRQGPPEVRPATP